MDIGERSGSVRQVQEPIMESKDDSRIGSSGGIRSDVARDGGNAAAQPTDSGFQQRIEAGRRSEVSNAWPKRGMA